MGGSFTVKLEVLLRRVFEHDFLGQLHSPRLDFRTPLSPMDHWV